MSDAPVPDPTSPSSADAKPPLSADELREVINLSLWAGQLLLQYGADAQRIEETVHRMGTALGADWLDVHVQVNGLVISVSSGGNWRTRARRVVRLEVDIAVVAEVNRLSRHVVAGRLSRSEVAAELAHLSTMHPIYPRWLVAAVMGLACAGFSQLFGGDLTALLTTLVAAGTAALVRQELERHYMNPLLMTVATAFVAGLLASSASIFGWSRTPTAPLAAAVLLLVPGVPLINSVEDLIHGHLQIGLARGAFGALISLGIALGLWLAIYVTSVLRP